MYKNLQQDVEEGITFEQVVMGFAPIICGYIGRKNKLVPKTGLRKNLTALQKELARVQNLSDHEAQLEHEAIYEKEIKEHEDLVNKNVELRKKYLHLIDKLKNWDVSLHEGTVGQVKLVGIRDLSLAMENHCYIPKSSPILYTGAEWKINKIKTLEFLAQEAKELWEFDRKNVKLILDLLKEK